MTAEYIKIFTGNSIFVNRLKSLLEQESIPTLIKDPIKSGTLAGFGSFENSVELFVLNTNLEKAIPVLETFKSEINL